MDKLEFQTSKEATWRIHLARHAASGKSIAAFCRDEAISQANFQFWRTKLANGANEHAARPAQQAAFIDLGAVNSAVGRIPVIGCWLGRVVRGYFTLRSAGQHVSTKLLPHANGAANVLILVIDSC